MRLRRKLSPPLEREAQALDHYLDDVGRRRRDAKPGPRRRWPIRPWQVELCAYDWRHPPRRAAATERVEAHLEVQRTDRRAVGDLVDGHEPDAETTDLRADTDLVPAAHLRDRVKISRPAVRLDQGADVLRQPAAAEFRAIPDVKAVAPDVEPHLGGARVVGILDKLERHDLEALKTRECLLDIAEQVGLVALLDRAV